MRIVQKLLGVVMILLGIISTIIDNDITVALLIVPLGLWMILSKEKLVSFSSESENYLDKIFEHFTR